MIVWCRKRLAKIAVVYWTRMCSLDLESNYLTLTTLIVLADLEATLRGGAWTLFAPTNAAFNKIDQGTLALLTSTAGKDDLIKIMTYHAIPQVFTSKS
jgi:uncharacterized surface protein with fasciclin (FAS1) repeats